MSLSEKQKFIKKHFHKHFLAAAVEAGENTSMPPNKFEYANRLYAAMMTAMEIAFVCEKIMIKDNPQWDSVERQEMTNVR